MIDREIERCKTADCCSAAHQTRSGNLGICVVFEGHDKIIWCPKRLTIGHRGGFGRKLGCGYYILPLQTLTQQVIRLEDGDLAEISADGIKTSRFDGRAIDSSYLFGWGMG